MHGERHPDVAIMMNNLAAMHKKRRNFAKAQELFEMALPLMQVNLRLLLNGCQCLLQRLLVLAPTAACAC